MNAKYAPLTPPFPNRRFPMLSLQTKRPEKRLDNADAVIHGAPGCLCNVRFVLSHPSRKNKDAARVGHPTLVQIQAVKGLVSDRIISHLWFIPSQVPKSGPGAPGCLCNVRFVLSHPSRKNKDAARVGHPTLVRIHAVEDQVSDRIISHLWFIPSQVPKSGPPPHERRPVRGDPGPGAPNIGADSSG
jgi:hypothetical protein